MLWLSASAIGDGGRGPRGLSCVLLSDDFDTPALGLVRLEVPTDAISGTEVIRLETISMRIGGSTVHVALHFALGSCCIISSNAADCVTDADAPDS